MTNEEKAIDTLFYFKMHFAKSDICREHFDMAIKALEQQPTTKNVLNQLKDEIHDKGFNSPLMNPIFTYTEIIEMIDKYITDIELQENEEEGGDSE